VRSGLTKLRGLTVELRVDAYIAGLLAI
jgi:hypothetical protein